MKTLLISGTLLAFSIFTNDKKVENRIVIESSGKKINHLHGTHIDHENNKYVHYINMLDGHRGISIKDTAHKSHISQAFEWIQVIKLSDGNYALIWQKIGGHYLENNKWVKELETHYFEIRNEFYKELVDNIKTKDDVLLDFPSIWYGKIAEKKPVHDNLDNFEKIALEDLINKHHSLKTRQPNCFVLQIKTVNNQKTVFFRLPEACPNEERRLVNAHFQIPAIDFMKAITVE